MQEPLSSDCLTKRIYQKKVCQERHLQELYMDNLENSPSELVAFVACNGHAAASAGFAACKSCAEAVQTGFRRGDCKSGCVGIGSCVSVCSKGALKLQGGRITVDRDLCNGCGDCAAAGVCPQHLIKMIPRKATNFIPCSSSEEDEETVRNTCGYGCIACGECERACPVGAVSIVDNHAVIDYSKCVGCTACMVKCKKKIILDTLHDLAKLKDKVAFVRCSGGSRAQAAYKELGIKDCHEAMKVDPKEHNLCYTSCCGLGSCVQVCRFGAISVVDGTAYVDPEKCVGCRDCVRECPRKIISIVPYKGIKQVPCSSTADYYDKTQVCDSGCTACRDCVDNCPNGAIYMKEMHAEIDPNACVNCKVCQYVCGRNVIREMKVSAAAELQRAALERVQAKTGEEN